MKKWLIAIRKEKGLSQSQVSEAVGISQPSYCNIENGERNPSVETAKKIADVLGFDWTQFYEDTSARLARYEKEMYSGEKTINQVRAELGLEPISGGDKLLISESCIQKYKEKLSQNYQPLKGE